MSRKQKKLFYTSENWKNEKQKQINKLKKHSDVLKKIENDEKLNSIPLPKGFLAELMIGVAEVNTPKGPRHLEPIKTFKVTDTNLTTPAQEVHKQVLESLAQHGQK